MQCHICGKPATGQCQTCWKFYCSSHGDEVCENCKAAPRGRIHLRQVGADPTFFVPQVADDLADENIRAMLGGSGMQGNILRGVLAVGEVLRMDRTDLSLLSLESYDDGFILQWRTTGTVSHRRDPMAFQSGAAHTDLLTGTARDDLGSEYSGWPGGGGGDEHHSRGETRFSPAIAKTATRLEFRMEEMQWAAWMTGVRPSAGVGAWTFEIPLANMKMVSG